MNNLLEIAARAETDALEEVNRLWQENERQGRRIAELDEEITKKLQIVAGAMVAERQDLPPAATALLKDRNAREHSLRQEISDLEAKLAEQKKKAETAESELAQAQASAQAYLLANPGYLSLVDQKAKVRSSRELAVANIDALSAECGEKLVAYNDHPFYQYLVQAKFGTPDYKRKGLIRAIDTWLAKRCNFDVNRRNELVLHAMAEECSSSQEALTTQHSDIDAQLVELKKEVAERFNVPALEQACGAFKSDGSDLHFPTLARVLGLSDERKRLQASIAARWEELNLFIAMEDPFYRQAVQATFSDLLLSPVQDVAQRAGRAVSLRLSHMVESLTGLGAERDRLIASQEQRAGEMEQAGLRMERAVQLKRRAESAASKRNRTEAPKGNSFGSQRGRSSEDSPRRDDDSHLYMTAGYVAGFGAGSKVPSPERSSDEDRGNVASDNGSRPGPVCTDREPETDTDTSATQVDSPGTFD